MVQLYKPILESIPNFRDLGGIENYNKLKIKMNTIYRSEALVGLTIQDKEILDKLNIKNVLDFRLEHEVVEHPNYMISGSNYINVSPIAPYASIAAESPNSNIKNTHNEEALLQYLENPSKALETQMRQLVKDETSIKTFSLLLEMLLDKNNLPLVFHCRGGKDRAGYATILILLILDVELSVIEEDYLFTNEVNNERNAIKLKKYSEKIQNKDILELRRQLMLAKKSYLDAAISEMVDISGSVENYIEDVLKIDKNKKERIKKNLLEYYEV